MSEQINRYEEFSGWSGGGVRHRSDGDYVRFEDHEDLLSKANHRIEELEVKCTGWTGMKSEVVLCHAKIERLESELQRKNLVLDEASNLASYAQIVVLRRGDQKVNLHNLANAFNRYTAAEQGARL